MAVQQVLDAKSGSRLRNVGNRPHQTFGRFHAGLSYLHAEEIVAFLWKVPIAKNARVTALFNRVSDCAFAISAPPRRCPAKHTIFALPNE